jgi:formylglycine-generating enzyme required for sulfatase activity
MRQLFAAILCLGIVSLSFGQEMVQIAGGKFQMGSGTSKNNTWEPVHTVTLSTYAIDKYEITYETWTKVRNWGLLHGYTDIEYGLNGCYGDGNITRLPSTTGANNPVTCVLWYDAVKWCNARSEMENLHPVYYTDNTFTTVYRTGQLNIQSDAVKWGENGYRLPTEAEWEFAARGGAKSHDYTYSGSKTVDDVAWNDLNSNTTTHPVGQKAANELGLFDMSGNVAEWCWDWGYKYDSTAQTNPKGATLLRFQVAGLYHRVIRGGNYVNSNYSSYSLGHDCYASSVRSILVEGAWWGFVGFRCVGSPNPQLSITTPVLGETVLADAPYFITWDATGIDSIKIDYSSDNGKSFHKITSSIPANTGRFAWHVPDTLSSKCRLVITNLNDPAETAVIENFRIKGYVLTRMNEKGDFEAFDPNVHGWQFANDGSIIWSEDWWERFNYRGTDPITGKLYHKYFTREVNAVSSDFPDWPLFAETFGINECYWNISTPNYKLTAVRYWGFLKKGWNGSCFGFVTSSLLEFDFSNAFRASFPQLGSYTNLIELPLNDYRRAIINQLWIYQYNLVDYEWFDSVYRNSPRATLQNAKDNFLTPIRNHSTLYMDAKYTSEGKQGGHSLLPYALKRIPNTIGQYELLVYDSNCPSGNCKNHSKPAIVIDSLKNYWSYPPLGWNSGESSMGIFFDAPVNVFLQRPILPTEDSLGIKAKVVLLDKSKSNIAISNLAGNTIGFSNTLVNTIHGAYPIIRKSGTSDTTDVPIGYVIPSGLYSITLNSFQDSVTSIGVFGNSSVFSYWRGDAVSSQTDHLTYDDGLTFRNPDAQTKTINLEAINRSTNFESSFKILNFEVIQNDSVRIESPDFNRVVLINQGPAKTYDLNIVQGGESSSGQFEHDRIAIPAHCTHIIVADSLSVTNKKLKIYEDKGNTGIISDSLFVTVQITGMQNQLNTEIDSKFSLLKIYPNPFNSTTTIKYKVTEPGFVSLKVFDAMGNQVTSLVNEQKPSGDYLIEWNAAGFKSGIYFCKLQTGKFSEAKKMLLLK